jgi:hypothetical protein
VKEREIGKIQDMKNLVCGRDSGTSAYDDKKPVPPQLLETGRRQVNITKKFCPTHSSILTLKGKENLSLPFQDF